MQISIFRSSTVAIAVFFIIEFLLILLCLVILGAFGVNLPLIDTIITNIGTTPMDLAIAVGVLGTLANFILMFIIAIFAR